MKITARIDYAATPHEVFVMLTDDEFQSAKCLATGALDFEVSVDVNGEHTVIVSRRAMPTEDLPDYVRNLVGERLLIVETHTWGPASGDGSRRGSLKVEVGSAPVGLLGTLSLAPGGRGAVQAVEGDLKARVPLIGGKIEKAAAPAIEKAIVIERQTGEAWLAG